MSVKILLTGLYDSRHRGEMAIAISTMKVLNEFVRHARFVILSSSPQIDSRAYEVPVVERLWRREERNRTVSLLRVVLFGSLALFSYALWKVLRAFGIDLRGLKRGLGDFDLLVDVSGDGLSEYYGIFHFTSALFAILLGLMEGKPVVIFAQSIGPFENTFTRFLATFILRRVNLITAREKITYDYLHRLVGGRRIRLTADPAFLLESSPSKTVDEILARENLWHADGPLIAVSPSKIIHQYIKGSKKGSRKSHEDYVDLTSRITDHLTEELGARVILLSHVFLPKNDDRTVCREIYRWVKNKDRVTVLSEEYTAGELKGIIGRCDMFIGCRMHPAVASTSMCIPTIAIAYSDKFHGIIGKMLGQEEYVIDVRNLDCDELFRILQSKIESLWRNRSLVRDQLRVRIKAVRALALLNGDLVSDLLKAAG